MPFSLLLQILQFALLGLGKRQPRSSSNQTSIGPLQALTPGSFISFLPWHIPSCILPKALMLQWKWFWKWPRLFSLLCPSSRPQRKQSGQGGMQESRGETSCSVAFGKMLQVSWPAPLSYAKTQTHSNSYTVHTQKETLCFVSCESTTQLGTSPCGEVRGVWLSWSSSSWTHTV